MAWWNYVSAIYPTDFSSADQYGEYDEYECELLDDLLYEAMDQLREYIPTDDSYLEAYLRRYRDGSTRIWVVVNDAYGSQGCSVEEEIHLDDDVMAELDEIELD